MVKNKLNFTTSVLTKYTNYHTKRRVFFMKCFNDSIISKVVVENQSWHTDTAETEYEVPPLYQIIIIINVGDQSFYVNDNSTHILCDVYH